MTWMGTDMLIHVENFKGLRNADIELGQFNMLIGANGAGKTSVLEFFKFIRMCTAHGGAPKHPFAPWWGFNNMVWSRDERLPIKMRISYNVEGHAAKYEATVTGIGGYLEFHEERLSISDYVEINRNLDNVEYVLSEEFVGKYNNVLSQAKRGYESTVYTFLDKRETMHLSRSTSILNLYQTDHRLAKDLSLVKLRHDAGDNTSSNGELLVPSPCLVAEPDVPVCFVATSVLALGVLEEDMVLLRGLDYERLYNHAQISNPASLQENGDGLVNILFKWHLERKWPRRIDDALQELFPGWQINFTLTDDGRILMRVDNGYTTLNPPSVPDGFYKLLAVLVGVELGPMLLLIDDLETSLHMRMIEYILGELRTCDSTVVVTTHSPAVIDLVNLEDIRMLEQLGGEVTCKRIDSPDKLRDTLQEKGLTMSEWWLYG